MNVDQKGSELVHGMLKEVLVLTMRDREVRVRDNCRERSFKVCEEGCEDRGKYSKQKRDGVHRLDALIRCSSGVECWTSGWAHHL